MRRAAVILSLMLAAAPGALAQGPVESPADQPAPRPPMGVFLPEVVPDGARPLKLARGFIGIRPEIAAFRDVRDGDALDLLVADGVTIRVTVAAVDRRSPTRLSIHGAVDQAPGSSVILVLHDDVVAGDIRIPSANKHFKLRYVEGGIHLVCDIDDRGYGECGGSTPAPIDAPWRGFDPVPEEELDVPPPEGGFTPRGACPNIENTFDVMVVYSNIARAAAGGTTAMEAEIQLGVDTANQTYNNSNVTARYRLVWQGEVSYDENGPMTGHRDRLADPSDGYYDSAVTSRDTYNADLCCIWVDDDDGGQWCGFAFCDFTNDTAYACVNWECAAGNFSYPHEHGHNQGCAHNPEDAGSGCNEFSYSYGHRFFASGNGYRTVMAYNNDAGQYTRIGYWSNPNVNYLGVATGTATRDNARTLNDTSGTVEGWQFTRMDVWIDADPLFPATQNGSWLYPYDTAAEGFSAIQVPHSSIDTLPVLHVVSGSYGYTGTITKKMLITTCNGAATIGN